MIKTEHRYAPSTLASILQIGIDKPCLVIDFAHAVHNSSDSIRASPVFAMESFRDSDPTTGLYKATFGHIVHQFIMITVHLRTDQSCQPLWTYLRVDFEDISHRYPQGCQTVTFSDDHEGLRRRSDGIGRVEGLHQPVENGPSLDGIASLLEVVHRRTPGGYNCFARNCLWLTENLLLSTALKYSQHWLAGFVKPEALKRYAERRGDAVACVTGMLYHDPFTQPLVGIGVSAWRGAAAFFTHAGPNRVESHDEDVQLILEEWMPCVTAGFI
ncbi:hypothetical protein EVJ58_g872 [Rhodofomes roseus]|uniref:Uncharacterized protein n=1 Tax=Rhodofomes roseus TaxID=34475 RepID=A0A4Y9Z5S2_9APHY|nr:hypothetical protein EVJ58_g872 [Rhodofomes roseus]